MTPIQEWKRLLEIAHRLLGPDGCPWDRKQTLKTLQTYLLEETHELLEAVDHLDPAEMTEEWGDVLYTLLFIALVAEREKLFTLAQAIGSVNEKLIRRHPHIFGETSVSSVDDIVHNWEAIKKEEKKRSQPCEGIPTTLPALTRAQKMIERLRRAHHSLAPSSNPMQATEDTIGKELWDIVARAQQSGIDAEGALRRYSRELEQKL